MWFSSNPHYIATLHYFSITRCHFDAIVLSLKEVKEGVSVFQILVYIEKEARGERERERGKGEREGR